MQTFLPERTFTASVAALDDKRLGKQRSECIILLNVLKQGPTMWVEDPKGLHGDLKEIKTPWYNHPACKMWRGFEQSLIDYGLLVCVEWKQRGFKDTCYEKIMALVDDFPESRKKQASTYEEIKDGGVDHPDWYNEAFIRAHRSNLIRKDPEFYGPKWPGVPNNLEYMWPTEMTNAKSA